MSVLSWLGNVGKKIFGIAQSIEKVAEVAAPIVAVAFPEVAPLYTGAIGTFLAAETAVSSAPGQGTTKLAISVANLLPIAQQFAQKNGIAWPDDEIKKWASAVVDTLNLIPAPTATPVNLAVNQASHS